MEISFDKRKRADTLAHRGLDFADAPQVFAGRHLTLEDDRRAYGETRFQSVGHLHGRMVMIVWTPRLGARHVISMRKCNDREQQRYAAWLE